MEKINFGTSLKNIPTTNKKDYVLRFIMKTEELTRRMRWKAYFFLQNNDNADTKENYGFKSMKPAPPIKQLEQFENDMQDLANNLTFHRYKNRFQQKLDSIVREINTSKNILVKADKTRNFYKLKKQEYKNLINKNLTKNYRKANNTNLIEIINTESKRITEELRISERVGKLKENEAYILLKDHKPDFNTKPATRLINPTRPEIGRISKRILERINLKIKHRYKLNQWINTMDTINWFSEINDKSRCTFIQFDIMEYYPSITKILFDHAIEFARNSVDISQEDINIIQSCRTTVLISDGQQWTKNKENGSFDVSMGSLDSAEASNLVGLYILRKITMNNNIDVGDIGLYRDDGLMVVKESTSAKCDKIRKIIHKEMNKLGLKVEITGNVKQVDFLDVTFNLTEIKYKPFMKENSSPIYVHPQSNHPPSIIKHIPKSIESRISNNSSDETTFNNYKNIYNTALKNSGYVNADIKYKNTTTNASNSRNRGRKIIWFTPPFNMMLKTKIGNKFLQLIDKHFPPGNVLHRLFNKNTLKLSYSCTDNIERIIKKHNNKILKGNDTNSGVEGNPTTNNCNCQRQDECPLQNNCVTASVIYRAEIYTTENRGESKFYIGSTSRSFKDRYYTHKLSFRNKKYSNTSLSRYFWKLIDEKKNPIIRWSIIRKAKTCRSLTSPCFLCLGEKLEIIKFKDREKLLNVRNETSLNCKHLKEHTLSRL